MCGNAKFTEYFRYLFYKRREICYNENKNISLTKGTVMINTLLRIYVRRGNGTFIFVCLFIAAAVLMVISLIPIVRYFRYRRTVNGRVTDVEITVGRHGRRDRLIVEYECDGTVSTVRSFYTYPVPEYEIGDTIPVRVSGKNPGNAMLPYDLEQAVSAFALSFGTLLLGLIVLITAAVLSNN